MQRRSRSRRRGNPLVHNVIQRPVLNGLRESPGKGTESVTGGLPRLRLGVTVNTVTSLRGGVGAGDAAIPWYITSFRDPC